MINHAATVHCWEDMPIDHPMNLIDRRRIIGSEAMISHVVLHKGFTLAAHAHDNEQFAIVLDGCVEFTVHDDEPPRSLVLTAGQVLHLCPKVPHAARALETSTVLDVFAPPSATTGVDTNS
jgi:quercetin dioxygenase-like cupin family protein